MKLLAIETSTEACSAALLIDDQLISRYQLAPRKHTELIMPMIDDLIKEADLSVTQLDGLAFGRGPGAFTGVRVATGVIQGIAFAADLPVAAISSLAALAQACWREQKAERVISAMDARMNEIYWGCYEIDNNFMKLTAEEGVYPAQQAPLPIGQNWLGAGSAWNVYADQLKPRLADQLSGVHAELYPHALDIASLGQHAFELGEMQEADQIRPVYLRDNVVS